MTLTQAEYEEKVQRRYDRMISAGDKAQRDGEAARAQSDRISSFIPMGQPILVGHHSEKRHRRDLERIQNGMRRGFELQEKAAEYRSRAASIENNDAIYSDNPSAVELIDAKLQELLDEQAHMKAVNAAHAKFLKKPASLETSGLSEADQARIRNYVPDYSWNKHPYPGYALTNLSANIRRYKERVQVVAKKQAMEDTTEMFGDIKIEYAPGENRIRIRFPARVDRELFLGLKSHGFRVLRSAGEGWFSAYYNNNALYFIKFTIKKESGINS